MVDEDEVRKRLNKEAQVRRRCGAVLVTRCIWHVICKSQGIADALDLQFLPEVWFQQPANHLDETALSLSHFLLSIPYQFLVLSCDSSPAPGPAKWDLTATRLPSVSHIYFLLVCGPGPLYISHVSIHVPKNSDNIRRWDPRAGCPCFQIPSPITVPTICFAPSRQIERRHNRSALTSDYV